MARRMRRCNSLHLQHALWAGIWLALVYFQLFTNNVETRPAPAGDGLDTTVATKSMISDNRDPQDDDSQPFLPMKVLVPDDYQLDEHFVTTDDYYILRVFRLFRPRPENGEHVAQDQPVVFLQHALLDSSAGWLVLGPGKSLALMLADEGFDVWMSNSRGNRFSRNHTSLNPDTDPEFWSFSWDQHALLDIPAEIQYVLSFTGQQSLQYVGYSQGTTMALAALSSLPAMSQAISLAALFAPVAFVGGITSLPFKTMANLKTAELFQRFGLKEFGGHDPTLAKYYTDACLAVPYGCIKWLQFLCGTNPDGNISKDMLSRLMHYLPSGTSTQNMGHWGQGVRDGGTGPHALRMYDYGTTCPSMHSTLQHHHASSHDLRSKIVIGRFQPDVERPSVPTTVHDGGAAMLTDDVGSGTVLPKYYGPRIPRPPGASCNQWEYGQETPPVYNLSNIKTPLALFTGGRDSLSDPADVQQLLLALPPDVVVHHQTFPEYAHLDFGLGDDAHLRLYPSLIRLLKSRLEVSSQ